MPKKQKLNDSTTKYQCCFGCLHVQTVTKTFCVLFLLNYVLDAKNFIVDQEFDYSEAIKIIFGFVAAIGPLIGIKKKKSTFFLPSFAAFVIRMFIYFIVLFSLCIIDSYTNVGQEINNIFLIDYYSDELETLLNNFPLLSIIKSVVVLFIILDVWGFYCTYKCYKYISAISLQGEYGQSFAKRTGKIAINSNLFTLNDTKSSIIKSLTIKKYIGCSAAIKFLFSQFVEKMTTVEQNMMLKLKTTQEPIQQLNSVNLKPVKYNLKMRLKNQIVQSESVSIVVKSKPMELLEKKIKQSKQNLLNEATSILKLYHSCNLKPKKLISIEIQTDETSFDQSTVKSQMQHINSLNNHDDESETFSITQKRFNHCSKNEFICDQQSMVITSSGFRILSDSEFSSFQTLFPIIEFVTVVMFLFKNDETFAVEIYRNGRKERLKNVFDNEWTPLFFSMAKPTPEIGEIAQIHYHKYSDHVLYDIFKVVGKPMNEIVIDPKWKFKFVEENGIRCYQIKTFKGLRLFPENSIVAAFLKSLKIQAENHLNTEINEVYLSSNFNLTESQKNVFKSAASKLHLKILSFYVNDI